MATGEIKSATREEKWFGSVVQSEKKED
uniref:Uncharacterized protein n=1 Tax=Nelumbo nucifera TaxID=4432 RepID=A0A822Z2F5_NELNU|nr:TPA_asm: hypothetical protein HUJ06_008256 [Nelumbo nucifera]